jgi:ABC-type Fe3+-siderophore transport system permease subunit
VIGVSLFLGQFPEPGFTLPSPLFADELGRSVFLTVRLPRVPAAFLGGLAGRRRSLSLVLCDDISRSLLAGEIPLGVITSLIGSVVFGTLLLRGGSAAALRCRSRYFAARSTARSIVS